MESFWQIVSHWDRLGQGVFFLLVMASVGALIERMFYYGTVMARGWPPEYLTKKDEEEEE